MRNPQTRADIYFGSDRTDRARYYPDKVVSLHILRGLAMLRGDSVSETIESLVNKEIAGMSKEQKEELIARGKGWSNKYSKKN